MKRTRWIGISLAAGAFALGVAAPVVAHHAFGAEFDADSPLQIEGEIVRLEWVNPHSWIHLAVHRMVVGGETITPPDPTAEVTWGEQSWEEMMIGFFDVAVDPGVDKKTFFVR